MSFNNNIRILTKNDYTNYYPLINSFRHTEFTEEEFQQYIVNLPSNMEIWVIQEDNRLVATGTIIYEPKLIFNRVTYAHVEDICVLESERGKGYGKKIVDHLFQTAQNTKCYKITLVCAEGTVPFYEKCGLEKRGVQCSQLLFKL
jgi:glucosamine-phosphate N-acetyltransferase